VKGGLGVVVCLVVLVGCGAVEEPTDVRPAVRRPAASSPVVPPAPLPVTAAKARGLLAGLPRAPRPTGTLGYVRDVFGPAWADIDGNHCNQRDDVLLRDVLPGTVRTQQQGACDHDVLAGEWVDPYTGVRMAFDDLKDLHQAQAIQIDHVVPLAEAWVSGASAWKPRRRLRYANDLGDLVAASGPVNASKGSSDPAAWRPKKRYQCGYATRWIQIKARWRLAVDPSEVAALEEMLGTCR
jgi:hypothetical protein